MADENTRYKLYDRVEGVYVGGDYTDRKRARTAANKKDDEYGSIRYSVDPVTYKDGAWRGRNDQTVSVRGGHALADRLGVGTSAEEIERHKKSVAATIEDFPRKLAAIKKPEAEAEPAQKPSGGGRGEGTGAGSLLHQMNPQKLMKKGGTASSRGDGCCQRGKTKGRMV
jgi:hypothetical protein